MTFFLLMDSLGEKNAHGQHCLSQLDCQSKYCVDYRTCKKEFTELYTLRIHRQICSQREKMRKGWYGHTYSYTCADLGHSKPDTLERL